MGSMYRNVNQDPKTISNCERVQKTLYYDGRPWETRNSTRKMTKWKEKISSGKSE